MDVGNGRGVADSNQPISTLHERTRDDLYLSVFEGLMSKFNVRKAGSCDVAEDVEGPFGFGNNKSGKGGKPLVHQHPAFSKSILHDLDFLIERECFSSGWHEEGGDVGRRTDVDNFDAIHDVGWSCDPSESPPSHGPTFGPTADGDGSFTSSLKGTRRGVANIGPNEGGINHVIKNPEVVFDGKINQPFGFFRRIDCTGWVVGGVENDGLGVLVHVRFELIKIRVIVVPSNRYMNGKRSCEADHPVVGRPSGGEEEDLVTGCKHRHHSIKQGLLATGSYHNIVGIHVNVELGQVLLNSLAQGHGPLRPRVGCLASVQRSLCFVHNGLWRSKIGLADSEANDLGAGRS